MPRTGPPNDTGPPGTNTAETATATVASVGPYRLNITRPGAYAATTDAGTASAPHSNHRTDANAATGTVASTVGVRKACVICCCAISSASSAPPRTCAGATTTVAPAPNPSSSSSTAASKLGEAACNTRAAGPTANRCANSAAKLPRPRCGTTTPLGRPVVPEV